MRKYPYYPAFDGKKSQPGTVKLMELCTKRWKCDNRGIYANRPMRNPQANGALSTHATGAAVDCGYANETVAREMWDWFLGSSEIDGKKVEHSAHLGIVELHWYAFGDFGATWRCSRGEGKAGVKICTATDNAGSYQGNPTWLHIELDETMASDPERFEAAWRSLPKPG